MQFCSIIRAMEWFSDFFFVNGSISFLNIWGLVLISASSFAVYESLKVKKTQVMTNAPKLNEVCNPEFSSDKKTSVTLTFCKKCGNHAIKHENGEECLSSVCRLKN